MQRADLCRIQCGEFGGGVIQHIRTCMELSSTEANAPGVRPITVGPVSIILPDSDRRIAHKIVAFASTDFAGTVDVVGDFVVVVHRQHGHVLQQSIQ